MFAVGVMASQRSDVGDAGVGNAGVGNGNVLDLAPLISPTLSRGSSSGVSRGSSPGVSRGSSPGVSRGSSPDASSDESLDTSSDGSHNTTRSASPGTWPMQPRTVSRNDLSKSQLLLMHALNESKNEVSPSRRSGGILNDWKKLQCAESFVPDVVIEAVVKGRLSEQPSQTRGVCVVLLADISGFTKLSERLSNMGNDGLECLSDTLNDYFGRMIDVIYAHGGDVIKFAGDALLAVWHKKENFDEEPQHKVPTGASRELAAAAAAAVAEATVTQDSPVTPPTSSTKEGEQSSNLRVRTRLLVH